MEALPPCLQEQSTRRGPPPAPSKHSDLGCTRRALGFCPFPWRVLPFFFRHPSTESTVASLKPVRSFRSPCHTLLGSWKSSGETWCTKSFLLQCSGRWVGRSQLPTLSEQLPLTAARALFCCRSCQGVAGACIVSSNEVPGVLLWVAHSASPEPYSTCCVTPGNRGFVLTCWNNVRCFSLQFHRMSCQSSPPLTNNFRLN